MFRLQGQGRWSFFSPFTCFLRLNYKNTVIIVGPNLLFDLNSSRKVTCIFRLNEKFLYEKNKYKMRLCLPSDI